MAATPRSMSEYPELLRETAPEASLAQLGTPVLRDRAVDEWDRRGTLASSHRALKGFEALWRATPALLT